MCLNCHLAFGKTLLQGSKGEAVNNFAFTVYHKLFWLVSSLQQLILFSHNLLTAQLYHENNHFMIFSLIHEDVMHKMKVVPGSTLWHSNQTHPKENLPAKSAAT